MSLRENILNYLHTELGINTSDIDDDTPLFSSSLLDSFSMVDLIAFIEKDAAISISPTEVSLDNLDSVGRILKFVHGRSK